MQCEGCAYYGYDEDWEEWVCDAQMDEDDLGRLQTDGRQSCPYYRNGDEYLVVRRQM